MSEVIEAIKKRNEELRSTLAAHASSDEHICPKELTYIPDDINTLLTEIASRDAEIERLQDPILCMCGFPGDAHQIDEDGLASTCWVETPYRTTAHTMKLTHRTPGDVHNRCEHGYSLHPAGGDECWSRYVMAAREQG